ncbi:cryptochrome/photolyase family protein [Mucilaginibacter sp. L3T2-6]|uniref:cryptochrome/photolyase family protein n=1 Tax=Mucilaginibacter sp. L3T2-6 TaxID=3062491 RepID=UPI0026745B11|nr:cryptochrome/photolyase family protein [Mucilaginibacter sp. L3T2-6]MDO3642913.1 cryptochrome/photolyase family protein [Mucilaginibacter sp. L3T2-6]MDV6215238.1 cryptochrome/photolyase family protein [Mucilaginibacter sp. L3T2-6]
MSTTLRLILGDQLNLRHSWLKKIEDDIVYVLMEVGQEQEYVKHHIQKILGFFAAMRNFAHQLEKKGHRVIYIKLDDKKNQHSFTSNLDFLIKAISITHFEYQLPDEYRLDQQLREYCQNLTISHGVADTEHFLTQRNTLAEHFGDRKSYLMENFYRYMRKRFSILMVAGKPVGGQWNFDADNRNKYDGKSPIPHRLNFDHDLTSIKKMVDDMNVKYFGEVDAAHFPWPLAEKEALKLLSYFCEHLLPDFGTYEDAMLQDQISLFHSRLSFALNTKMITPMQVIQQVIAAWEAHKERISLQQVEGFVRQVIGWREFMRGVYWAKMPGFGELNFFNNGRKLPEWFWTAETKMNCLAKCIGQSLEHAWAHHIQRLMVIGNFALLMGSDPDEVDAWYLGVYIDAIQWVEITNTRGMSQFADGGIIASKPYISSAAYINRMSDYCKHCHYDFKKKHGERACPYNSLYWHFIDIHRDRFYKNPRMSMVYKNLDRMDKDELEKTLNQARKYLDNPDSL